MASDHQKEEQCRIRAMRNLPYSEQVWHIISDNTIPYEPGPFWPVETGPTIWDAEDLTDDDQPRDKS